MGLRVDVPCDELDWRSTHDVCRVENRVEEIHPQCPVCEKKTEDEGPHVFRLERWEGEDRLCSNPSFDVEAET